MLKKLLNIDGAVNLSKAEQKKVKGGIPGLICGDGGNCPPGLCCSRGVCKDKNLYPCE